jgi:hypothetical protein
VKKGCNYGLCKKCNKIHYHATGYHVVHSEEQKEKWRRERKGKNHPSWKGGKILVDGYMYIHAPDHPNATKDGYMVEHRLVMEKKIGRLLSQKEVVHHIDGDKLNNKPHNLSLEESTGKHFINNHLIKRDSLGRFSCFA